MQKKDTTLIMESTESPSFYPRLKRVVDQSFVDNLERLLHGDSSEIFLKLENIEILQVPPPPEGSVWPISFWHNLAYVLYPSYVPLADAFIMVDFYSQKRHPRFMNNVRVLDLSLSRCSTIAVLKAIQSSTSIQDLDISDNQWNARDVELRHVGLPAGLLRFICHWPFSRLTGPQSSIIMYDSPPARAMVHMLMSLQQQAEPSRLQELSLQGVGVSWSLLTTCVTKLPLKRLSVSKAVFYISPERKTPDPATLDLTLFPKGSQLQRHLRFLDLSGCRFGSLTGSPDMWGQPTLEVSDPQISWLCEQLIFDIDLKTGAYRLENLLMENIEPAVPVHDFLSLLNHLPSLQSFDVATRLLKINERHGRGQRNIKLKSVEVRQLLNIDGDVDGDAVFVLDEVTRFVERQHLFFVITAPTRITWDKSELCEIRNLTMTDTNDKTYEFGNLPLPSPCTAADLLCLIEDLVEPRLDGPQKTSKQYFIAGGQDLRSFHCDALITQGEGELPDAWPFPEQTYLP